MKLNTTRRLVGLLVATLCVGGGAAQAQFNVLHTFTGGSGDGNGPYGSLVRSGATLYGLTSAGGSSGQGAVFSIGIDGGGYAIVHPLTGNEGSMSLGSLALSGATLYGMTYYGGSSDQGAIFSVGTDGSNPTALHSFTGPSADGATPVFGAPVLSGATLYGMTSAGGSSGGGALFAISANGGSPTILHSFTGSGTDGVLPYGQPILSGAKLYGMTVGGGSSGAGTVFSIGTDGLAYSTLYSFTGTGTDGRNPYGSLTLAGTTLYGMTSVGGANGDGVIFALSTSGGSPAILHSFTGADGAYPYGSLTLSADGSMLYGMTSGGGANNYGAIFQMQSDGSAFTNLYSFTGFADGAGPRGDLTLSADGAKLYGMTLEGGGSGVGTVFSLGIQAIPEPATLGFMALLGGGLVGWRRLRRWRA